MLLQAAVYDIPILSPDIRTAYTPCPANACRLGVWRTSGDHMVSTGLAHAKTYCTLHPCGGQLCSRGQLVTLTVRVGGCSHTAVISSTPFSVNVLATPQT